MKNQFVGVYGGGDLQWKLDLDSRGRLLLYHCCYYSHVSGGRDRKGGPIVTIKPQDDSDVGVINIGKLMAYLSKIPE